MAAFCTALVLCAVNLGPAYGAQNAAISASNLFPAVFAQIQTYHLRPPQAVDLARSSFRQIQKIDPLLALVESSDFWTLRRAGQAIAQIPLPQKADTDGWANIAFAIVQESREHSPDLRRADFSELQKTILGGLVKELDKYSHINLASRQKDASILAEKNGGHGSIGVTVAATSEQAKVHGILPDSPAQSALKIGDRILSVDGVAVSGMDAKKIVRLLKGEAASLAALRIERAGRAFTLHIPRAELQESGVTLTRQGDIAIIKLKRFGAGSADKIAFSLRQEQGLLGTILDLRGNRGGVLEEAVAIADLFLKDGELIAMRGRHPDSNFDFSARAQFGDFDLPLVVLIDGETASAAEVLAIALRQNGRAAVIGSHSYGKGAVQRAVYIEGLGRLALTWSELFAPQDGMQISDQGLSPDVCMNPIQYDKTPRNPGPEPGKEVIWLRRAPQITWNSKTCPKAPRKDRAEDLDYAKTLILDKQLHAAILADQPLRLAGLE